MPYVHYLAIILLTSHPILIIGLQAEAKAQEARNEYEDVSKLIKVEVGRFELERVSDFKASLEVFLEGMIARQNDVSLLFL